MDPSATPNTESLSAIAAKIGPPASVSLATIVGYNVSELILWATLIYTILMISGKLFSLYNEVRDRFRLAREESLRQAIRDKHGKSDDDGYEG
jgi:hypothetical protein